MAGKCTAAGRYRAAVLLVFVAGGCSTAGHPVPGTDATATTRPTAGPVRSLAEAMREWEALAGGHFTESARALEQVSSAADDSVIRSGCALLHDANAVGLQDDLPTPDPALTAELQRMIDDMNSATHACLRFVDDHAGTDASTYQDYLARAVAHLQRAKVILNEDLRGR